MESIEQIFEMFKRKVFVYYPISESSPAREKMASGEQPHRIQSFFAQSYRDQLLPTT
jgi:hypothetical protein